MFDSKLKNADMDALYQAVLSLETEEECYRFFEDLCTINELLSMSQRYAVARYLKAGDTYATIADATGASTATISRVNRCLAYGTGGYDTALSRRADEKTGDGGEKQA